MGETFYDIITNKYQDENICKKANAVNHIVFFLPITFTIMIVYSYFNGTLEKEYYVNILCSSNFFIAWKLIMFSRC